MQASEATYRLREAGFTAWTSPVDGNLIVKHKGEVIERLPIAPDHMVSTSTVERLLLKAEIAAKEAAKPVEPRLNEQSALVLEIVADALDCVHNAAVGESHRTQEGIAFASILSAAAGAMSYSIRKSIKRQNT